MKNAKVTLNNTSKFNNLQIIKKSKLNAIKGGIGTKADPPRRRKKQ